jgi:soluble lytic murein transglycosylase-like protein
LLDLGLDAWARAEVEVEERHFASSLPLARAALASGSLAVYRRAVEPWVEARDVEGRPRDLLLHPLRYLGLVQRAAGDSLDPLLALAVIQAESAGDPDARSAVGALGLMQLMPATARRVADSNGLMARGDPLRLRDPRTSIVLGCAHLEELDEHFGGREERVLAAYNAGRGAVERWEASWPGRDPALFVDGAEYEETRDYVRRVLSHRGALRRVVGGLARADTP